MLILRPVRPGGARRKCKDGDSSRGPTFFSQRGGAALLFLFGVLATSCGVPGHQDSLLRPVPYDNIIQMDAPTAQPLPKSEIVLVLPSDSPEYRLSRLAVSAGGVVAMATGAGCQIVIYDPGIDHLQSPFDACPHSGGSSSGVADLVWISERQLEVFDIWTKQIRIYDVSGTLQSTTDVITPDGAFVTAAFSTRGGMLIAFEPVSHRGDAEYPARLVQLRSAIDNRHLWSGLERPALAIGQRVIAPLGVELCIQGGDVQGREKFVAMNRWAYDVFIGQISEPTEVFHTDHRLGLPYFDILETGQLSSTRGARLVACSRNAAVAVKTLRRSRLVGGWRVVGVMDLITFDGTIANRFRISERDAIAQASDVSFDDVHGLYALVREEDRRLLVRYSTDRLGFQARSTARSGS